MTEPLWIPVERELPKERGLYETKTIMGERINPDGLKVTLVHVGEDEYIPGFGWFNSLRYDYWRERVAP